MSTGSPIMDPADGGILDGLNATFLNTTTTTLTPGPTTWLSTIRGLEFVVLEAKMVLSAAGIIYLGAHAALKRPPSAAPPRDKKARRRTEKEDKLAQGLELSDAILFPIMAGLVLVGLYHLLQWLNDPAIVSKILRWYMSMASVASLVTLYAHGVDLAAAFVFPRFWRGWDSQLRTAHQKTHAVVVCDDVGNVTEAVPSSTSSSNNTSSSSPLPGILAWLTPTKKLKLACWKVRSIFKREWLLRLMLQGVGEEQNHIRFAAMMALPLAAVTALFYFRTASPMLSNMLGYGMCYFSLLILSPTDLLIGSLVLWGLFFYDIFMVFYTPYMVTVATALDVPIKLQFKSAERQSILGLGDIVIPGIFVAWALRADLWLHYRRKIRYEATELEIVEKDESGQLVKRSEVKHREIKAPYREVKGQWGDWFWTRGWGFLRAAEHVPPSVAASNFPKTYFYASMAGYLLGMLVTVAMLLVFKRGQPALLYLVPGVLGATYVTALVRGEFRSLWQYTEDGSLDNMDVVVDVDADGNPVKTIGRLKNGVVDTTKKDNASSTEDSKKGKKDEKREKKREKNHYVFLFTLEAPPGDRDADGDA